MSEVIENSGGCEMPPIEHNSIYKHIKKHNHFMFSTL